VTVSEVLFSSLYGVSKPATFDLNTSSQRYHYSSMLPAESEEMLCWVSGILQMTQTVISRNEYS
jgi:hypothetical protein